MLALICTYSDTPIYTGTYIQDNHTPATDSGGSSLPRALNYQSSTLFLDTSIRRRIKVDLLKALTTILPTWRVRFDNLTAILVVKIRNVTEELSPLEQPSTPLLAGYDMLQVRALALTLGHCDKYNDHPG